MSGREGGTEWRGGQQATEPLIEANDSWMLTHTIAVICLPYHLFPHGGLIDDTSCLNATAIDCLASRQWAGHTAAQLGHQTITPLLEWFLHLVLYVSSSFVKLLFLRAGDSQWPEALCLQVVHLYIGPSIRSILLMQYLKNVSREFLKICYKYPLVLKDDRIPFWWSKAKVTLTSQSTCFAMWMWDVWNAMRESFHI